MCHEELARLLTSHFAAPRLNWLLKLTVWRAGLQNSFGGAEQPRMIELLVYNVGGQLVLRGTAGPRTRCHKGHIVLGPAVWGGQLVLGPHIRGDIYE